MAVCDSGEVIDSQILAEHVGFLDNCFDNSFNIQNSLVSVKEYAAEELKINVSEMKSEVIRKKLISSLLSKSAAVETSLYRPTSVQAIDQNLINKKLKNWGLPEVIAQKYEQRGITEMFDWQVTCLANSKVLLDCCNLVYSAPTSAGKTLVAEILTIKTILERQKKVIIILPFVSIVREKMFYLQDILSSSGIRVEGFMGSQSPPGGLQAVHVAICTIEKANSLINRLLDDGNISELGAVIVDELHLLGDPHRGYILELLLTKIKYVSSKSDNVQIQIVGMSATLPNLEVLADWLSAELFITQFRPIPLDEFCLVGNKLYNKDGTCANTLTIPKNTNESDCIINICLETIKDSCSILIFCMTKNRCENLAQTIASSFYNLGRQECEFGAVLRNQLKTDSITEVLEQLKNCPVGLDQVLKQTISFGVSYHHAGLTFDERDIIEGAFKSGAIRVLVATSTLSSGVNLPARKVIIRSPLFMREPINILTYKQMIGRAGRMGKDTKGESILICTENEKKIGFELMMGALDPVKSCIETADKYMRAVLEMIASQVLCTKSELDLYSKCTLLFTQQNLSPSANKLLETTLEELKNYELVRVQDDDEEINFVATPLGKACLSASMAPNDGLSLFVELQKARQCLVLETDLHLIYLVTPYSVSSQWGDIDWLHLLTLWESLTKAMKRVGELVGVQESFIIRCLRGTNKMTNAQNKLNIHKRFYTALALQDLVNEVPLSDVANKFQCARGFLQSLQQAAATFAGMVTAFCRQLGWKNMEILISQFQDRLHFGISSDLIELMKLSSLNGVRARSLFDSGYETITSIASADVNVIENILHKAVPFQSEKERDGDDSYDLKKRNKIKSVWITGCCGMTAKDAAQNLIIEARKYLENEIGVPEIKWSNNVITSNIKSIEEITNVYNVIQEETDNPSNKTIPNDSCAVNEYELKVKQEMDPVALNFIEPETKLSRISVDLLDISSEDAYIETQMQSTPVIITNGNSRMCTTSSTNDDIVWDSLNFTEAALGNITKLSTLGKESSQNISFGNISNSGPLVNLLNKSVNTETAKGTPVKDISLFSTDEDNSSIFDESLPLDTLPSILLDNKNTSAAICLTETTSDFVNINSDSILDAFKSNLVESNEDQDIKLFFEEDDECEVQPATTYMLNDNEVGCSQNDVKPINEFKSPYNIRRRKGNKAESMIKVKENIQSLTTFKLNYNEVGCFQNDIKTSNEFKSPRYTLRRKGNAAELMHQAKNKKLENVGVDLNFKHSLPINNTYNESKTIHITNQYRLNCVLVQGNEIFENLGVLESINSVSLAFKFKQQVFKTNTLIGDNILKVPKKSMEEDSFIGLALYIGKQYDSHECVFMDLKSLGNKTLQRNVMKALLESNVRINMHLLKKNYLHLKSELDMILPATSTDVCIAEWLIDSDTCSESIEYLMLKHCKIDLRTAVLKINHQRKRFNDLDVYSDLCIKAWCLSEIAEKQSNVLFNDIGLSQDVIDMENQVALILASSESSGITVDRLLASQMLIDVQQSKEILQKTANKLAGSNVNLLSSKCVAKILGINATRGKVSTKKSVLSCHNSQLSSIIIFWRKLECILTKTLYPLTEKVHIYSDGNKIKPTYTTTHTCTGRISMHEPNLQNVPRTFSIPNEYLEISSLEHSAREFNCRNIFKASEGYVMVAADYCQLEMRVLTHLSGDSVLMGIMRSDVDVFKSIAASWSNVPEHEIDDDLRQKAKQICYGILYGMGDKTLSQHLDVSELEAKFFMDSFYSTFPHVKQYKQSVIDECREKGYVETLMKRRRLLPGIKSPATSTKGAAERQAVNTTIQGSAADIAKAAMCAIEQNTKSHKHKPVLLLQMHDELIYEVLEENKQDFTKLLKEVMEGTVKLRVPLPVKVKSGYTWGSLNSI